MLMLALFLGLPQLVGWIASRVTHRSSALPWPAAAIVAFSALWYVLDWLPAQSVGAHTGCGVPANAAVWFLVVGLVVHTGAGVVFGSLTRRRRPRV
jgi:hypothetical protein